ncbi:hypothetical protein D8B26_000836 [Coccidioides posadasii str. Silveira]|uniref:uncharacterized protein n=1 Tax=Coccidioides posadasii (strain RMSCC 757 / Silveira) TaxID=443226 RepID=UPI001BEEC06F|nr:hypothetical protein D8B26_000836 [Coccidioides posadasii str. Silveira]
MGSSKIVRLSERTSLKASSPIPRQIHMFRDWHPDGNPSTESMLTWPDTTCWIVCGVKTPLFYHIIIQAGLIHEWALSTEQQLEYKFLVDSRRNAPEVLRTRLLSKYFKKFEYFTVLVSFVYPYVVRQRHGFDRICRFDAVVLFQTFLKHAAKQQIRTVRFDWLDWQAGCQ